MATITAIIAQAMSQLTLNLSPGVLTADLTYAQLGVASGVLTILSLPMLYVSLRPIIRSCTDCLTMAATPQPSL